VRAVCGYRPPGLSDATFGRRSVFQTSRPPPHVRKNRPPPASHTDATPRAIDAARRNIGERSSRPGSPIVLHRGTATVPGSSTSSHPGTKTVPRCFIAEDRCSHITFPLRGDAVSVSDHPSQMLRG